MNPEPRSEHLWLKKLVGNWAFDSSAVMGPDQPERKSAGTQSVRALGDLWIEGEIREPEEGGEQHSVYVVGFDPGKGRAVGSFASSMMPELWIYDGEFDLAANKVTLNSVGKSMAEDGTMANYQDIIEFTSDDEFLFRSRGEVPGVGWTEFMTMTCRRTG